MHYHAADPVADLTESGSTGTGATVSELIASYWDQHVTSYYVQEGQPTREQDNIRQALRFLRKSHGACPAADFGPKSLKTVREAMIAAGRCRTLINKDVGRIRSMFRWAVENVLLPAVTLGLLSLFHADTMIAVGFLILASCPGAPVGPPITAIARGDVPWSLGMMLILAALSAILTPALLSLLLPWVAPANDLRLDYWGIIRILLLTQLLPLALGLGFRHAAP